MKNLPIYCIIVIGNPLTYLGHNLVWDRVRLLKQYDSLTFDYNASGIRTRKGSTTYELDGTTILSETGSGYTLRYLYGLDGLVGFKFGDNNYYYEKNLQGDITGIYDSQGTLVGSYSYDAWGKCSVNFDSTGAAFLNPFRYRGYYYDRETSLYYTATRYYDPTVGRWINADLINTLSASPKAFTDKNLYAYCDNNPVSREDGEGNLWFISAGIGLLSTYVGDVFENINDGKTGWEIIKPTSSLAEYITSAVLSAIPGGGFVRSLIDSMVTEVVSVLQDAYNGEESDLWDSIHNIVLGTVASFGFEFLSDKITDAIFKLRPKNYSSYANKVRKKAPNLTRQQVTEKLRRSCQINDTAQKVVEISLFVPEIYVTSLVTD